MAAGRYGPSDSGPETTSPGTQTVSLALLHPQVTWLPPTGSKKDANMLLLPTPPPSAPELPTIWLRKEPAQRPPTLPLPDPLTSSTGDQMTLTQLPSEAQHSLGVRPKDTPAHGNNTTSKTHGTEKHPPPPSSIQPQIFQTPLKYDQSDQIKSSMGKYRICMQYFKSASSTKHVMWAISHCKWHRVNLSKQG